ncbi:hypothetical protein [Tenacibaculum maritimum]|uniref:hypothetical protein n=3 Tax=Tenacibaculum maritimum TaxID=107401 RepID=UPI003891124C
MNLKFIILLNTFIFFSCKTQEKILFKEKERVISLDKLYPEDLFYYKKDKSFLLSSFYEGAIFKYDPIKESIEKKIDLKNMISPAGISIKNDYLYIVNGDSGLSKKSNNSILKKSSVFIYDLKNNKLIDEIELNKDKKTFANDIVRVGDTHFITDSKLPFIYKLDSNNKKSIFLESNLFKTNSWGLNGIDYNNYYNQIFTVHMEKGKIYTIDIDSKKIKEVHIKNKDIKGIDGITFLDKNKLIGFQAYEMKNNKMSKGKVLIIETNDKWETANVIEKEIKNLENPTNGIKYKDNIYFLDSKIGEGLFKGTDKNNFKIIKI